MRAEVDGVAKMLPERSFAAYSRGVTFALLLMPDFEFLEAERFVFNWP